MAEQRAFVAVRDLITLQLAFAIKGRKFEPAEALMMLGDVLEDLEIEHGVEFAAGDLTSLVTRLAIKAQEAA